MGYATPLALVLSLSLALIAGATISRSVTQLRLARADYEKRQAEYVLDGAHLAAVATIIRSNTPGPYAWAFTSDVGWVEAAAQVEAEKLTLEAASTLDEAIFARFGVTDAKQLKARLAAAASVTTPVDIAALDDAPAWRACGPIMISPAGRQAQFTYLAPSEPGPGPTPALWHVGEAWRIRLTTATGWRDDRIVRFTGDARHPAAVIVRRLSRGEGDGAQCDQVLAGVAAGRTATAVIR